MNIEHDKALGIATEFVVGCHAEMADLARAYLDLRAGLDFNARNLFSLVRNERHKPIKVTDLIYETCDRWHRMGLFYRTDEFIRILLYEFDSFFIENKRIVLAALSVTKPAEVHLVNRRKLVARATTVYGTSVLSGL